MNGRFVRMMLNLMQIAMQAVGVNQKVFFLVLVLFCCGGAGLPRLLGVSSEHTPDAVLISETLEQLLDRAAQRANEYTAGFVDLTVEENKLIELFGSNGKPGRQRNIFSELVIYESGSSREKTEFRDVQAVNGHMVTEHEQRLLVLLREVINGDPDVEVDRASNEQQHRYDLRYHVNGFTLHQALPLRSLCRPQFHFEIAGREGTAPERLVVNYQQIGPCSLAGYGLPLPRDLRYGEFRHRGRLWLDVITARLWREEQDVWVRPKTGGPEFRVIRTEYDYAPSNFDLLLPKRIRMEIFDQARMARGRIANLDLGGRIAMSYGEFSRFNVSTSWKAKDPKQTVAER